MIPARKSPDAFWLISSALAKVVLVALLCFPAGGCATLFDPSFEDTIPPVYLSPLLDPEIPLAAIVVEKVRPRSPAEEAGVRTGDRILAMNGVDLENSARKLHGLLFDWSEEKPASMEIVVWRKGKKLRLRAKPRYGSKKGVLGIRYEFRRRDGKPLRHVQFVREKMSDDGLRHEALYDFGRRARVNAHGHLWGDRLLVAELFILNDSSLGAVTVDPDEVQAADSVGYRLYRHTTDAVVNEVYDIGAIYGILNRKISLRKKKAREQASEMHRLRLEFSRRELKKTELLPGRQAYGVLVYPLHTWQLPITIDVKVGKEKFSFRFGQAPAVADWDIKWIETALATEPAPYTEEIWIE